ncbi:MAG: ribosomal-processing cysteine protease Prp [Lachnospiraceae bacterium]|jgi:uncharacterized protein YsxB (DUF464 family)|nr:ribosomal-processing cysteine protease Prp [Lachnospiraceae bacterium]
MINVRIEKDKEGFYRSFICTGHAEYAEEGADIVCSGVSALVINTVNCLEDLLHAKITTEFDSKEGGYLFCRFEEKPDEKASFLVDCMIHGFDWIIVQYGGKYLRYTIKEA